MNTRSLSAKRASSMLLVQTIAGVVLLLSFMMLVTDTYTDGACNTTPKDALELRQSLLFWHGLGAIVVGVLWMALAKKESADKFEHDNGFTIVALGLAVMPTIWLFLLAPVAFVGWVWLCDRPKDVWSASRYFGAVTCFGFAATTHLFARFEFDLATQVGIAGLILGFTALGPALIYLGQRVLAAREASPEFAPS